MWANVAASLSAPVVFQIANDLNEDADQRVSGEADVGSVVQDQLVEFTVTRFRTANSRQGDAGAQFTITVQNV